MTRQNVFSLLRRLAVLSVLITCLGVFASTDLTPKADASVLCCYCDYLYNDCLYQCGNGGGYNCSSNCADCCRWNSYYIPHCYATCWPNGGQSCSGDEQCPL